MKLISNLNDKYKQAPFLIFISFLISFVIARIYVILLGDIATGRDVFPFERYMIHHLYYGIALLIISGWMAIIYKDRDIHKISAVLYGAGLGIFFDEIGLMLTHFEDYWDPITYTVVILISLIFLNIIFFKSFWKSFSEESKQFIREKDIGKGPFDVMEVLNFMDNVENKIPRTNRLANIFLGIVLFASGILVIKYPQLISYWVAAAFFLSSISYVVKGIT